MFSGPLGKKRGVTADALATAAANARGAIMIVVVASDEKTS